MRTKCCASGCGLLQCKQACCFSTKASTHSPRGQETPGTGGRDADGDTEAEQAAGEEEDPAVRERLRRVRGEPSGQDLSCRVFVGGMPFSYEVRAWHERRYVVQ